MNGVLRIYLCDTATLKETLHLGSCSAKVLEVSNREFCFQLSASNQIVVLSAESKSLSLSLSFFLSFFLFSLSLSLFFFSSFILCLLFG